MSTWNSGGQSPYRWTILFLAWLAFFASWVPRVTYSPLIPEIRNELNLSYSEAGLLMTGFWIGYMLAQIPSGILSDRFGAKRTFVVALSFVGIFTLVTGFADSFSNFIVFRFLTGLSCGCIFAPSSAIVIRWFAPKDRAVAIGIQSTSANVGMIVGLTFSPIIALTSGTWRWSFWILSIPAFASVLLIALLLKEKSQRNKEDRRTASQPIQQAKREGYASVFREKRMWLLCAGWGSLAFANQAVLTWSPTFLVSVHNVAPTFAGSISSLYAISSLVSSLAGGLIADRILRRRAPVMVLSVLSLGLGCVALSALGSVSVSVVTLILLLMGFFGNMAFAVGPPMLSEWFPMKIVGTASGLLNSAAGIGGSIGPFVFGRAIDITGAFAFGWLIIGLTELLVALGTSPALKSESDPAR